jgi:uncharacterized membrane protein
MTIYRNQLTAVKMGAKGGRVKASDYQAWVASLLPTQTVAGGGITELVVQDVNDPKRMSGTYRDRGVPQAFTKKGKQFTTIRVPGAEQAGASGINNQGVIVGTYGDAVGGFHAFIYQATTKTMITLDVPGASVTTASGINKNGHIVGSFDDMHHATTYGWLYVDDVFTTIDAPCGGESTNIADINAAGLMAVACFTGDGGTFSYAFDGTTFTPLEVPGAFVTQVSRLNNAGQFVGWYSDQDGKDHGFIAAPSASAAIFDKRARLQYAQVNHGVNVAEFLRNRPPWLRSSRSQACPGGLPTMRYRAVPESDGLHARGIP